MQGACARCCRTQQQNTHVTERREVLYPWHPWFGLSVHIHQKIERGRAANFRCSLDGVTTGRSQELPVWMFDRVACLSVRIELSPRVDLAALAGLWNLLREAMDAASSTSSSRAADSGAGRDPRHQNRRTADAKPVPQLQKTAASSPAIRSVRRSGSRATMAAVAAGDPLDGDGVDGTPVERTSAIRKSGHRGRAVR